MAGRRQEGKGSTARELTEASLCYEYQLVSFGVVWMFSWKDDASFNAPRRLLELVARLESSHQFLVVNADRMVWPYFSHLLLEQLLSGLIISHS